MIVTSREFRANQSRYIGFAHNGEDVILKSRAGSVRLIPVDTSETKTVSRNLAVELQKSLLLVIYQQEQAMILKELQRLQNLWLLNMV